ncbi:MAG: tryptophan synthase subunit alpha [Planctomycetota bacterium]
MSSLDQLFESLRSQGRKAFMPFVTAGDPNIQTTAAVIDALRDNGANLCEVGIPYSDPIADGPVVASSYQRALDSGFRLQHAFDLPDPGIPRVTMASYAIIHRIGAADYVAKAAAAGYAGAIVPDLLSEEAEGFSKICRQADFNLIQLVTPTTTRERQKQIADLSSGFIYYVSVTGITGERTSLPSDLVDSVGWLREQTQLPVCIGFGISSSETAARLSPIADGLIVGSAIVRRVHEAFSAGDGASEIARRVGEFGKSIRTAIDDASSVAS